MGRISVLISLRTLGFPLIQNSAGATHCGALNGGAGLPAYAPSTRMAFDEKEVFIDIRYMERSPILRRSRRSI